MLFGAFGPNDAREIDTITFSNASVPEPSSVVLMGLGLGLLALVNYVRRQGRLAGLQIG